MAYQDNHAENDGHISTKRHTKPSAKKPLPRAKVSSRYTPNESNAGLSRTSGAAEQYYSKKRRKGSGKKHRRALGIFILAALVAAIGIGASYFTDISNRLTQGIDDKLRSQLTQTEFGEPFYMLLLGTDKSKSRVEEQGGSGDGFRSDTIILARVDPKTPRVTLVSIHRDTLVDLGSHGKQKINAAYAIGGPAYATEVVSKFAGVPISHYAEVDFNGFLNIIDQIGGIEVNVPIEVKDERYAKGHLYPGVQTLNSDEALFLCRARHAYDAYGDGDSYRAANQRAVIAAIVKKVLAQDPAKMASMVSECADYVTTDLDLTSILSLATQMKDLNTSTDIYSGMDPTISKYVNKTWYEICDTPKWQQMMQRVNDGLPPYPTADEDPTRGTAITSIIGNDGDDEGVISGSVSVLNGTGKPGIAAKYADKLTSAGFTAHADNAVTHDHTTIVYNGEHEAEAKGVIKTLSANLKAKKNNGNYPTSSDVVIVIGKDWVTN